MKISFAGRFAVQRSHLLLLLLLFPFTVVAEQRYVTDQFEITLRTGEDNSYRILRMLPSGESLDLLEERTATGYSRVRTKAGQEGYVLTRELLKEPVARQRLAAVEAKLADLQASPDVMLGRFNALQERYQQLEERHNALDKEYSRIVTEYDTLLNSSQNLLDLTAGRDRLQGQVEELQSELNTQQQLNASLNKQTLQNWFLIGAGVLFAGILLGVLLPRLQWGRKRSNWSSL
ncbi:MAG: TIGR04211 family SH3 domain-containing protein [Gammaproteobacteria bacterium]|nr:TIGR04211 family SH3 domain-containing protein [Gammaproteobacteria bacterium]